MTRGIWLPSIPRTGTSYITSALTHSSTSRDWNTVRYEDSYQPSDIDLYNKIVNGHNSYYNKNWNNVISLLVIRLDVIARFVSTYNMNNFMHGPITINEYIAFNQLTDITDSDLMPFVSSVNYLSYNQSIHSDGIDLHDTSAILQHMDGIYITGNIPILFNDLTDMYGYSIDIPDNVVYNSSKEYNMMNNSDYQVTTKLDLTSEQLASISELQEVTNEFEFISACMRSDKCRF